MRMLITGGAGFIGSHLAEGLVARGHDVTVVDDLSTGSLENLAALRNSEHLRFVRASVRDPEIMNSLVDHCDAIYHLAAAVGVKLIVEQPVHTIETNIHGSEVVLSLASRFGRRILVASTSEVYGKSTNVPFHEEDDSVLGSTRFSRWSYACSKMVDEFLTLAYHDQFGLEGIICRFFNTIGPRQTGEYGMVVPRFVDWALSGEPVRIYGTGAQQRCFCHVADVVRACIDLMECDRAVGQVINVGSTESISIENLADRVIALTGSHSEKVRMTYEQAYGRSVDDMLTRVPDLSRIGELIGYEPRWSLEATLQEMIDFQRSRQKGT